MAREQRQPYDDDDRDDDSSPNTENGAGRKRLVMKTLLKLCRELELHKKYRVFRGAVNWSAYDFSEPAIAVMCDESSLMRTLGTDNGTVTLEMMTRMPQDVSEIDDELADDLYDDATTIFNALDDAEINDDAVITLLDRVNASAIEVADPSMRVQGVVATVNIRF